MVSEPDVDDAEDVWNNADHGVRYQITDDYVAITAVSHVGNDVFVYFTPAELDELIESFDTVDGRFYNLRVEREGSNLDIYDRDNGHIVTVGKEQLQDIADGCAYEERSFVEYLKDEYGEDLARSIEQSDELRYGTEFDAVIVFHNGLVNSSLAQKIADDDNVSLATTYVTDSEWNTRDVAIVMGLRDNQTELSLKDVNVYPFSGTDLTGHEDNLREADGAVGTYIHDGKRRLVIEKDTEADAAFSQYGSNDGTYYKDENPLDCLK